MPKNEWLDPIPVSENMWLYAEGKGLCVVRELTDRTIQFYIPWRKIERAIELRRQMPSRKRNGKPALRREREAS